MKQLDGGLGAMRVVEPLSISRNVDRVDAANLADVLGVLLDGLNLGGTAVAKERV